MFVYSHKLLKYDEFVFIKLFNLQKYLRIKLFMKIFIKK